MSNWWSAIKTYVLVTMVTLLIWVWAEAESLSTVEVAPRVELSGLGTNVAPTVIEPGWTGSVRVRVRGSTAAVGAVQTRLASGLRLTPGIGGVPATPGEHTLVVADVLRQHPDLSRLGVNFIDVQPVAMAIRIDELASRVVDVHAVIPGLELAGEPTVIPPQVTVRVSKDAMTMLPAVLSASATPDLNAYVGLVGDGPHTVPARVSVPNLPPWIGPATLEPSQVQVTFTRRSKIDTLSVPQAPVWVILPPGEAERWNATPTITVVDDVSVTGPRELVEQLRAVPEGLRAYAVLSVKDLRPGEVTVPVVFTMAPSPLKFTSKQQTVTVRVEARK